MKVKHIFNIFMLLGILGAFGFYVSDFEPSIEGHVLAIMFSCLAISFAVYDYFFGGKEIFRKRKDSYSDLVMLVPWSLCFLSFYLFGVYCLAAGANMFGELQNEEVTVLLSGNTGSGRLECNNTIYIKRGGSRVRYCLSSKDYMALERAQGGSFGFFQAAALYRKSIFGKALISVK